MDLLSSSTGQVTFDPPFWKKEKRYYERLPSKQLNATAQYPHLHQQQLSPPKCVVSTAELFFCLPGVKTMDQGKQNQCDHLVTSDMLGPALLDLVTYDLPSDFAVMFTWSLGVSQSFQHKLGVTVDLTN